MPNLSVQPLANQPTLNPKVLPAPQGVQPSLSVQPLPPQPSIGVQPVAPQPEITSIGDAQTQAPYTAPLSMSAFGQLIKSKYPDYADVPDEELAAAVIAKHPEYADKVQQPTAQPTPDTTGDRSKGFFGRLYDDLKGRVKSVGENEGRLLNQQQGVGATALQDAGQLAGGIGDVISEGLTSGFRTLAPQGVQDAVKDTGDRISNTGFVKDIAGRAQTFAQDHPVATANLGAVANIASILPTPELGISAGIKGAVGAGIERLAPGLAERVGQNALVTGAKDIAGAISDNTVGRLSKSIESQPLKDALEVTLPVLSKAEKAAAISSGDATTGVLGGIKIIPSKADQAIAASVEGIVQKGAKATENISAVKQAISHISEGVGQELKQNNGIFNKEQLTSALNKAKESSRVIFGSDKTLETQYNSVVEEMLKQVDAQPKNLSGLWDARKAFDDVIEEKFGKQYLSNPVGDNIRRNAVRDVRRTVNDYIASRLPEGNAYKQSLSQLSNMYEAVERIGINNTANIDRNIITKGIDAIKAHPLISFAAASGIVSGSALSLLSNPAVIGALVLGGSVVVGKKVITSQMFREALLKTLQGGLLSVSEKQAVKNLINSIDTGANNSE